MSEHLFLKGQRVVSSEGIGEVIDAVGDKIVVKLDNGAMQTFPSNNLRHETALTD